MNACTGPARCYLFISSRPLQSLAQAGHPPAVGAKEPGFGCPLMAASRLRMMMYSLRTCMNKMPRVRGKCLHFQINIDDTEAYSGSACASFDQLPGNRGTSHTLKLTQRCVCTYTRACTISSPYAWNFWTMSKHCSHCTKICTWDLRTQAELPCARGLLSKVNVTPHCQTWKVGSLPPWVASLERTQGGVLAVGQGGCIQERPSSPRQTC